MAGPASTNRVHHSSDASDTPLESFLRFMMLGGRLGRVGGARKPQIYSETLRLGFGEVFAKYGLKDPFFSADYHACWGDQGALNQSFAEGGLGTFVILIS